MEPDKPAGSPYTAQHVRKGIGLFLSGRAVQLVANIATMLILVREMAVADYAQYVTATAAATVLGTLSILGMDRLVMRYVPQGRLEASPAQLQRFIRRLQGLRTAAIGAAILAMVLAWPWASRLFHLESAPGMLAPVAAFALAHALLLYQSCLAQSLMLQKGIRDATTLAWLFRLALLVPFPLAALSLHTEYALWVAVVSDATVWLMLAIAIRRHMAELALTLPARPDHAGWPGGRRELAGFALTNFLSGQIAFPIQPRMQLLVAAAVLPPVWVAAYGFLSALTEQIRNYLPLYFLRTIIEPVMTGRYFSERDSSHLNAMASAVLKLNLMLVLPLLAWLGSASDVIVALITGNKFVEQSGIWPLMMTGLITGSNSSLLNIVSNCTGNSFLLLIGSAAGTGVVLGAIWLHFDTFGPAGLALSEMLFGVVFFLVVNALLRRKGFHYRLDGFRCSRMAAVAAAAGTLGWFSGAFFEHLPLVEIAVSGFVTLTVFLSANLIFKPYAADERALLGKVLGRFKFPF
jgi:O-antigen/teichoic acid export membrane protein